MLATKIVPFISRLTSFLPRRRYKNCNNLVALFPSKNRETRYHVHHTRLRGFRDSVASYFF